MPAAVVAVAAWVGGAAAAGTAITATVAGALAVSTTVAGMLVGAVVGAAIGAIGAAITGGDVAKGAIMGAIGGAAGGFGAGSGTLEAGSSGVGTSDLAGMTGGEFGGAESAVEAVDTTLGLPTSAPTEISPAVSGASKAAVAAPPPSSAGVLDKVTGALTSDKGMVLAGGALSGYGEVEGGKAQAEANREAARVESAQRAEAEAAKLAEEAKGKKLDSRLVATRGIITPGQPANLAAKYNEALSDLKGFAKSIRPPTVAAPTVLPPTVAV